MVAVSMSCSISWESDWTSLFFLLSLSMICTVGKAIIQTSPGFVSFSLLSGNSFLQVSISFLPKVAASLDKHLLRKSFTTFPMRVTCSILHDMGRLNRVFIRSRPIPSSTEFDEIIVSSLVPIDVISFINSEFSPSDSSSDSSSSGLSSNSSGSCMFQTILVSAISRFSISSLVSCRGFESAFSFGLLITFAPPFSGFWSESFH